MVQVVKLCKSNEDLPTLFDMEFVKAFEANGDPHVTLRVSDTRLDRQVEKMEVQALHDMKKFLDAGTVMLLPEHGSTFEMGYSTKGEVVKATDGEYELFAEFRLKKEHPFSMTLYNEVEKGECKRQASVGGRAKGVKVVDDRTNTVVKVLKGVDDLEHVACTRFMRSAVPSAKFFSAMIKSVDWDTAETIKTGGDQPPKGDDVMTPEEIKKMLDEAGGTIANLTTLLKQSGETTDNMRKAMEEMTNNGNVSGETITKYMSDTNTRLDTFEKTVGEQIGDIAKSLKAVLELQTAIVTKMSGPQSRLSQMTKGDIPDIDTFLKGLRGEGGDDSMNDLEKEVKEFEKEWKPIKSKIDAGIPLTTDEEAKRPVLANQRLTLITKGATFSK